MNALKILFLSAEVAPFAKTGGLGDVGASLPKALTRMGHDVHVVMPAYQGIEERVAAGDPAFQTLPPVDVPLSFGRQPAGVFHAHLPGNQTPVYFIAENSLFGRDSLYGYEDDAYRFAFYCRAALELCARQGWRPDVVHANDWHTAMAIAWLDTAGAALPFFRGIPSLFTIHNLMHQGRSAWGVFDYLGIQNYRLQEEGYQQINWMARAIHHSTLINTVSPTYAREIMTPDGGYGLDGMLRFRSYDVHGILNGIDLDEWDPAEDTLIPARFDSENLPARQVNKADLQLRAGLPVRPDVPVVAMVTRLDWQKGLDITGHVIHQLMNNVAGEAQFVVLGTGEPQYHEMFSHLASYHREKMTAFLTYDNSLAHLIYAGSDVFLMPSRFEPCGLGQMLAMRYGSVPVVRATGGLADTVQEGATGFTFNAYSSDSFWHALERALFIYRVDKESWKAIQTNGMEEDFSWERSAQAYQQLYAWGIARKAYEQVR